MRCGRSTRLNFISDVLRDAPRRITHRDRIRAMFPMVEILISSPHSGKSTRECQIDHFPSTFCLCRKNQIRVPFFSTFYQKKNTTLHIIQALEKPKKKTHFNFISHFSFFYIFLIFHINFCTSYERVAHNKKSGERLDGNGGVKLKRRKSVFGKFKIIGNEFPSAQFSRSIAHLL